ncbi:MAG: nitrilase-related carbon-nitrogen hydrolase, partial [Henriciella sp.]
MSETLKILVAQLNPIVGDIDGNLEMARRTLKEGANKGADLVVFAEMFLLGYPPEDLVLKPSAVEDCMAAVKTLAGESEDLPGFVIGTPWAEEGALYNSAVYCADGKIVARYDKQELPNYGVFDEQRLFTKGKSPAVIIDVKGVKIGLAVCEDVWFERVPRAAHAAGAELLLVPNGS